METKAKRKHPRGTAYVDELYTIPGLPAEQARFVEKRFMQAVDNWAAMALAIMLRKNPPPYDLDDRMKVAWARFLYSLIIRTPEHIKRIQQKVEENPPKPRLGRVKLAELTTRHADRVWPSFVSPNRHLPAPVGSLWE